MGDDTYNKFLMSHPDPYQRYYDALRRGLPERYWIAAPHLCGEYGHLIDGNLVNEKILKWLENIRVLWHNGVLPRLETVHQPTIMEIGAGYGGMAHHLMTMFPGARYVIVDIPETLLFSASYLTMIHGKDRVQLLDSDIPVASISPEGSPEGGTFLMVPNVLLSSLSSLHFGLAINMNSFQEMIESQVTQYLEFLAPRSDVLYSRNIDEFEFSSDKVAVTPLLRRFFDLTVPDPWPAEWPEQKAPTKILRAVAGKVWRGIVDALYWPDRKAAARQGVGAYLAVPKGNGNKQAAIGK